MASRRCTNRESPVLADGELWLLRADFQAVPEPAYLRTRWAWIHRDDTLKMERRLTSLLWVARVRYMWGRRGVHGGRFKDLSLRWESQGLRTWVVQHTVQSQTGLKQVFCWWLLGAKELKMTEKRKRRTMVNCNVPNRRGTDEHVSGIHQSPWPPLFSKVWHPLYEPHMRQHPSSVHHTSRSTVPSSPYAHSYAPLR